MSDRLLGLHTEPRHVAYPLLLDRRLQRIERVDPQRVEQLARLLRPETGDAGDLDEPRRVLRLELDRTRDLTPLEQRVDLLGDRLADTRERRRLARPRELGDRDGRLAD